MFEILCRTLLKTFHTFYARPTKCRSSKFLGWFFQVSMACDSEKLFWWNRGLEPQKKTPKQISALRSFKIFFDTRFWIRNSRFEVHNKIFIWQKASSCFGVFLGELFSDLGRSKNSISSKKNLKWYRYLPRNFELKFWAPCAESVWNIFKVYYKVFLTCHYA